MLLILFGFGFAFTKGQVGALTYISGAGVLYGFVASLAKVVIQRLYQADFDLLTLLAACLFGWRYLPGWLVRAKCLRFGAPGLGYCGSNRDRPRNSLWG